MLLGLKILKGQLSGKYHALTIWTKKKHLQKYIKRKREKPMVVWKKGKKREKSRECQQTQIEQTHEKHQD